MMQVGNFGSLPGDFQGLLFYVCLSVSHCTVVCKHLTIFDLDITYDDGKTTVAEKIIKFVNFIIKLHT